MIGRALCAIGRHAWRWAGTYRRMGGVTGRWTMADIVCRRCGAKRVIEDRRQW